VQLECGIEATNLAVAVAVSDTDELIDLTLGVKELLQEDLSGT
jgi:hypothetical protein